MEIELTLHCGRIPLEQGLLDRLVRAVFHGEGRELAVHVLVTDDERMRELHAGALGEDSVTDVIAFGLSGGGPGGDSGEDLDGEVVVNAELAEREARARGHDPQGELLFYVAHGLLHLLGYDDDTAGARREMHERQAEYLRKVGLEVSS